MTKIRQGSLLRGSCIGGDFDVPFSFTVNRFLSNGLNFEKDATGLSNSAGSSSGLAVQEMCMEFVSQ